MKTVTQEYVKNVMVKKYGSGHDREMLVTETGLHDYIMYLRGSPPKGYVLTGNGIVSFYDLNGQRYKIMRNTYIEDE